MARSDSGKPRLWQNFDKAFFSATLLLCLVGLATLFSSTYLNQIELFYRQIVYLVMGFVIALLLGFLDYRFYERLAFPFYYVVLLLLLFVDLFGKKALGAQRWIDLGVIHLQPSELAKLAIIFVFARFYSREKAPPVNGYGFRELIPVFFIIGVPILLIFGQPDLGTAMMVAFVGFTIIFFCGLRWATLMIMFVWCMIAAPLAYHFVLHEYQRDRVQTFLDPQRDPLGEGYHSIQSMIAVGSGEFSGKGFLAGTQSKLEFLPKHHTDFIFSAFAEEWGFVGSCLVLALFAILIWLGVDISRKSKDKFGSILALGSIALIAWHVVVNIGMEIGVLPVVGVTMPFFSYGGSSLITNMVAVGILLSVSMRRHIF